MAYLKAVLEKFPVRTSKREYLVNIEQDEWIGLTARVYMKNWKKIHLFKFIRVYTLHPTLNNHDEFYKKYGSDYIKLATDAVNKFERWEEKDIAEENAIKDATNKFKNWNGNTKIIK